MMQFILSFWSDLLTIGLGAVLAVFALFYGKAKQEEAEAARQRAIAERVRAAAIDREARRLHDELRMQQESIEHQADQARRAGYVADADGDGSIFREDKS